MEFFRVYGRVLGLLRDERKLAITLAFANVAVAGLQFYEPVLFGRVVDLLSNAPGQSNADIWHAAKQLLVIWAVVGLGGIVANIVVSLQADRMAHRRRLGAMATYFEHVLMLPFSFHNIAAFRPAAQDHADRRRPPVRHLAQLLPREPRDLRGAVHHAAAQRLDELAARGAADRADHLLRHRQRLRGRQDRPAAGPGRGVSQRARRPGGRRAGQHPPDPELRAAERRGRRDARHHRQTLDGAVSGAELVGAAVGADARRLDRHGDPDLRARRCSAPAAARSASAPSSVSSASRPC